MSENLMKITEVNSKDYWDRRFETDWKERGGVEQSAFFSRIAIDNIPSWLKTEIQGKGYHVCDWGCAFGDGTQYLKNGLNIQKITGVDFSDAAIDYARNVYPGIDFLAADFTKKLPTSTYDVLFTSNTLEHFDKPWSVLNKIASIAKAHIIVLVPFKEYDRFEEHFYTFDFNNIPVTLSNDFILTHSSVADTSLMDKSYWPGKQILLVYSSPALLKSEKRMLADISFESILHQKNLIDQLHKEIGYQLHEIKRLTDNSNDWQKIIGEKDLSVLELQKILLEKDAQLRKYETAIVKADEKNIAYKGQEELLDRKDAELKRQENEIKELKERAKKLEQQQELNNLNELLQTLRQENAVLNHDQKQLEFVNGQLQKEIIVLINDLSNSRQQADLLARNISRAEELARQLQQQNTSLTQENESMSTVLQHLRSDLYTLKQHHHILSSAYSEILNSRSWRYTGFIRRPTKYVKELMFDVKQDGVKSALRKMVSSRPGKTNVLKPLSTPSKRDMFSGPIQPEKIRKDFNKTRVCLFVKEFNSGGLERVVFDLAVRLNERNYSTSILIANQGGKIEMEAIKAGVEVFALYEDTEKLQSFIKNWQPDIVLTNHCYFGLDSFGQAGISIAEVIHNAYFWQKNNHYCREIRENYISHFIAVSEFVKQYAIDYLHIRENSISLINNGLNPEGFIRPLRSLRSVIRKRTGSQFTFVLSANFRPSKCHYTAVEALKIVHRKFPDVKLQFAGGVDDENLYQLLRNKVMNDGLEEHVEFLGLLNRRQLSHVMARAKAAILPSSYEGFSITTLEYMFFGLPMILTDVGAAKDLIQDQDVGIIITSPISLDKMDNEIIAETGMHPKQDNIQKLADAMEEFIVNKETWTEKGESAAEKIQQFMIDTVVDKYVTIIEKIHAKK
jgi:glycosyltransferase involved in cell wall biosynthesis